MLGDPNYTTDASRGFFIEENASLIAIPSHTNFTQDLSLNLNTTVSAYATPAIVSNISQTTTTDPSFAPGVAFGINSYIRGLDGTYTYMVPTTGGTPPNPTRPNFNTGAMLFQLPDVSTNLATITGPNQITFNGITKGQGRNKYFEEGSIVGNPTRGVMDSSAWGFSWKINDGAAEYPMVSDGDGSVWESAQSAPACFPHGLPTPPQWLS